MLKGQCFSTDDEVQAAVRKWIISQPESFFMDGMKKWIERLNKYGAVSGDYDEKRVYNMSFLPQCHDSPGRALAFSRSLFQANLLPASVLQFLILKTSRTFSTSSIHLRFGLPFLRVPIG
ncbi:hypothetical protein TNCV_4641391 [Trichonephila clavipes]|nr:hypothetical protein TNCV_4641391 [Trichonephila clavipes]